MSVCGALDGADHEAPTKNDYGFNCVTCSETSLLCMKYRRYRDKADTYSLVPNSPKFAILLPDDKREVLTHRQQFQTFKKNWLKFCEEVGLDVDDPFSIDVRFEN